MRHLSIIFIITLFSSCKTEYRKVIESFPNGKVKIENVYPDKNDKSKYTIIEYYQNGQISFKGTVENKKFIGVKLNYYENGNLKEIDSILNLCPLDFCCCDGKVINYYSNGKLDQTYEIKDGIADGLVYNYDYDSSGNLNEMFTYKKGKRNGIYKSFVTLQREIIFILY
jgi:antitoxin component YwqK of YwqJK toxin-antitoxin module